MKNPEEKNLVEPAEQPKQKLAPPRYDPREAEPRWQKWWQEKGIFKFDESKGKIFSIDTPPPYPSGELHPGHMFNWSYIDFVARYKRMRGFAVHFPQGWDVHGLPTETKVEKWKNKRVSEVPRELWIKWCEEWTNKYIKAMKEDFVRLGVSMDWSLEYKTSDADYLRLVQLSFLKLLEKGYAYRGRHPINWCTNDRTAIANAEIEYQKRKAKIRHVKWNLAGGDETITIATTRPELLAACVGIAVNPEDAKNSKLIGKRAIVPLFGQEVSVFGSEVVDPAFGSGIVMVCTFGDKQDVDWTFKHSLPIIDAIDTEGKMTPVAKKYQGLTATEAKEAVVTDLIEQGLLEKTEELDQNVGVCWRCKCPIEILNTEQWFVQTKRFAEKVIEATKHAKWWPAFMSQRQIDWTIGQTWDWVISRQKVYGTPIPIWYCDTCKQSIVAKEEELPIDPTAAEKKCPKCKQKARGETDTMDTWMDSSVTPYFHAGWPAEGWEKLVPQSLQANGHEIIRTWDYYLMLRSLQLTGKAPYENVLINGWVRDESGLKMSKSLGNYVPFSEVLKRSYADAGRYWAGRSTPGYDFPFSFKEIQHAERFYTKLWNIHQFLQMAIDKIGKSEIRAPEELVGGNLDSIEILDRWMLSKLQKLIAACTEAMESYYWPILEIEGFVWQELADNYIEMIKHRIYENKEAGQAVYTLYTCLEACTKLLAPFAPHITEEIYQRFFKKFDKASSIHLSKWPEANKDLINKEAEELGEQAKDIVAAVRQWKTANKLPLNAPLKEIIIDADVKEIEEDLKGTLKAAKISQGKAADLTTEKLKIGLSIKA
jgi:valyl-tRNA synthetase